MRRRRPGRQGASSRRGPQDPKGPRSGVAVASVLDRASPLQAGAAAFRHEGQDSGVAWTCPLSKNGPHVSIRVEVRYAEAYIEDTMGESVKTQLSDSVRAYRAMAATRWATAGSLKGWR